MKRIFTFFLSLLLLVAVSLPSFAAETVVIPEPTLSPDAGEYDAEHPEKLDEDQLYAASAVLITADKGEVIFDKDAYSIRYPASTTKILTVYLCLLSKTAAELEEKIVVSETAMDIPEDSSTMGLHAGEEIRLIDVLYGTIMLSGNEGANVIAENVSGSISAFVDLMNQTVADLGCTSTHFVNPTGYHDDNHYTTAYDMALIARAAMEIPKFKEIVSTTSYDIPRTNMQRARTITTKSEYMLQGSDDSPNKYYYPYATGIKTGSTSDAGYCFVGAATKDEVDLISVVFFTGKRARWADTIKLMNYGFTQYEHVTIAEIYNRNPITIETSGYSTSDTNRGKLQLVCTPASSQASITATKTEIQRLATNLTDNFLIQYTRDFATPITAGEQMGTLTYFPEDGEPVVYNLTASRSIAKRENAPKTIEEIVNETNADPNPFPPLSFDLIITLTWPLMVLGLCILLFNALRKKIDIHHVRSIKPGRRYLK